jgi:hypothetical protein
VNPTSDLRWRRRLEKQRQRLTQIRALLFNPASASVVFAKMVDEIVRHDPAAAWKRLESASLLFFSVGPSLPMGRECKARQIRENGAHGPALSAGTLPRGLQNVVRNFEPRAHDS